MVALSSSLHFYPKSESKKCNKFLPYLSIDPHPSCEFCNNIHKPTSVICVKGEMSVITVLWARKKENESINYCYQVSFLRLCNISEISYVASLPSSSLLPTFAVCCSTLAVPSEQMRRGKWSGYLFEASKTRLLIFVGLEG